MFYSAEIHYNNPADFGASVNYIAEYMASNTSRCKGLKKVEVEVFNLFRKIWPLQECYGE
jgi:hypothetical protein